MPESRRRRPRSSPVGDRSAFTIAVQRDGDRLNLRVRGELDIATVPEFERTVALALGGLADTARAGARAVPAILELDLSRLGFIDLQGVRAVCRCAERVDSLGAGFSLTLGSRARRTFALCGALERFEPASAPD
jgi:anti-anti-sigma factor